MATYKILIQGQNGAYQFATKKEEITETITNIAGEQVVIGTGKYKLVTFETTDTDVLKEKYIELLETYRQNQLNAVSDITETVTINVEFEGTSGGDPEPEPEPDPSLD